MTILVTGATGTVGRQVIEQLTKRGADVRALVRDPAKANLPAGVTVVHGDLLDVDSLRGAFSGVSTLFLLNAVASDEFTQALIALNLAREAGVERIVYLSVIHSDLYVNVPHFAGKFAVERMIEKMGFNATILRPAYFMNNDLTIKDVVTGYGVYPMPIGSKGLAMIDARDIGEIAAIELIRREQSATPLPLDRINLVGPDVLADGVRHAADERAFPHRGNDPRARRRCAPDCASGPSSALLSRLRLRDRRLGLTTQASMLIRTCEPLAERQALIITKNTTDGTALSGRPAFQGC